MRGILAAVGALAVFGLGPATAVVHAQPPRTPPARVRGTIDTFHGHSLTVKTHDGRIVSIALQPNFTVQTLVRKRLTDIHNGDFIASTSVRGKDGNLHAIEVHIFLPAQHGVVPEGQFPWDLRPNSLMTNAVVEGTAAVKGGRVLTVTYKGQTADIEVDRGTPIVAYAAGEPGMLKHGRAVFVFAARQADGSLTARSVTVESNSVKPPM